MTGPVSAYAPNPLYMATAWDPAGIGAVGPPTGPSILSNSNRTCRRADQALHGGIFSFVALGNTSRGSPGSKVYLEFVIDDVGNAPVSPIQVAVGIGAYPTPPVNNDAINNLDAYHIYHYNGNAYMTGQVGGGSSGINMANGQVVALTWEYGVEIKYYIDNVLSLTQAFPDLLPMKPVFAVGQSFISGPDSTYFDEQVTLQGIAANQTYAPPAGFVPWG